MRTRLKIPMAVLLGLLAVAMFAVPAQAADAWHYSGEATGLKYSVFPGTPLATSGTIAHVVLPDAGGGPFVEEFLNVTVPSPVPASFNLSASLVRAETEGAGSTAESKARVADLTLNLTHLLNLTSTVLHSTATATCGDHGPELSGSSEIARLFVNGTQVTISGSPNQHVDLGPVDLYINEQTETFSADGQYGEITVTALRITVTAPATLITPATLLGEIVVAQSQADVRCPPTNGGVIIDPVGDIGGPCADPAYYGIFDNTQSTVAVTFRFRWYSGSGLRTFQKTVPAGAIYRMWEKWVKSYTWMRVGYLNPATGNWVNLVREKSVSGYYPPCEYQRGFEYTT